MADNLPRIVTFTIGATSRESALYIIRILTESDIIARLGRRYPITIGCTPPTGKLPPIL